MYWFVLSERDAPLIPSLGGGRHCTSHSRSVSWSCIVFSEGDAPLIPSLGGGRHCTSHSGSVFSDGDIWRVSACQSCTCRDGQIHCFYQTCPLLTCNKTMLKKGHCCPFCQGNIVSHSYILFPSNTIRKYRPNLLVHMKSSCVDYLSRNLWKHTTCLPHPL